MCRQLNSLDHAITDYYSNNRRSLIWKANMTPKNLRAARKALGLTQNGLADALRMGKNGWQSVSRWEQDGNTIPGPVQVAIEALLRDNTP
jgi:DNA-binding transcriptional regulator YiaG